MSYLYVDCISAMRNTKTSEVARAGSIIADSGIPADEVAMFRDCDRTRSLLSFYCNRLIACADTVAGAEKYRAVMTDGTGAAALALAGYTKHVVTEHRQPRDSKYLFIKHGHGPERTTP